MLDGQQHATAINETDGQTRFQKGHGSRLQTAFVAHLPSPDGFIQHGLTDGPIGQYSCLYRFHSSISTPSEAPNSASKVLFVSGS
ncbi:hypothetical protein EMIT0P100_170128 [Pseudomonas sp. IT-P100]